MAAWPDPRTIRDCAQCGGEMEPFFDSTCEPPVAWLCQACGVVQMDVPRATLSPEGQRELAALEAFMRAAGSLRRELPHSGGQAGRPREAGSAAARARARALLEGAREFPVDVLRLAEQQGYPVRERALPEEERGTIGRDGDHVVIVLNRARALTDSERRWVIAEELGHAVLGHSALVASRTPGTPPGIAEPRRREEEREAKAFAAEILMPEDRVRARFAELAPRLAQATGLRRRETEAGEIALVLARMFGVSPTAMRVRLSELDLLV